MNPVIATTITTCISTTETLRLILYYNTTTAIRSTFTFIITAATSKIAPKVQLLPHPALELLSALVTTFFFRAVYVCLRLAVPAGS